MYKSRIYKKKKCILSELENISETFDIASGLSDCANVSDAESQEFCSQTEPFGWQYHCDTYTKVRQNTLTPTPTPLQKKNASRIISPVLRTYTWVHNNRL